MPSPLVEQLTRSARLADGAWLTVRPILSRDRSELADAYRRISIRTKHLRFFAPPERLSVATLKYLTSIDYTDHYGLIAYADIEDTRTGIGVARWIRDRDAPEEAEAAITVVDSWQRRGVGTLLLRALIEEAVNHGISVFTADVLWENHAVLEPLLSLGAKVRAQEPGIARVEFDLRVAARNLRGTPLHHFFSKVAADAA